MKRYIFLLIILTLVSCSVATQTEISPEAPDTISEPPSQPTAQPTSLPTTQPTSQPTALASKTAGVLLATWDVGSKPLTIRLVDPATGQEIGGFEPFVLESMYIPVYALSPKADRLAILELYGDACESSAGGTACRKNAQVLHLLELSTSQEISVDFADQGWVELLAFSPDGAHLALVRNYPKYSNLYLYDVQTGQVLAQQKINYHPTHLSYSPDGDHLVLFGQPVGDSPGMTEPDPPRLTYSDAESLVVLWEQELDDLVSGMWCVENCEKNREQILFVDWRPAVVPSKDGSQLYIVHPDQDRLTTVDFDSRTVHSTQIYARGSILERLLSLSVQDAEAKGIASGTAKRAALSLDGKQLYVASRTTEPVRGKDGSLESAETRLELQTITAADGREVASQEITLAGTWHEMDAMELTSDGAFLVLKGWSDGDRWSRVFEAQSLKIVAHMEGWELALSRSLDGQPVILANQWKNDRIASFAWLDPQTFEVAGTWQSESDYAAWLGR